MSIVELRQYTLLPGRREALVTLFEREFVTGQEAVGIRVGDRFRDLDAPDRFVWLRHFPGMADRAAGLAAFYERGPVWREFGPEANATMLDSDDVLLLRGEPFTTPSDASSVTGWVCHPADPDAFAAFFAAHVRPALEAGGTPPLTTLRTEHAENDYPRLPVRTGEDVFVWFTAHRDADDRDSSLTTVGKLLADADMVRDPQVLRLSPVRG
ncbi:NIPSNAP family protein [Streptomyces sp. NPDC051940]|uniref:NIPSNAP family protein n=1 Tax=Streptomyces sp. NPDC051940 TaxID=3155675 RepID=UPI0034249D10